MDSRKLLEAVYFGLALMPLHGIAEGAIAPLQLNPATAKYVAVYLSGASLYGLADYMGYICWCGADDADMWEHTGKKHGYHIKGDNVQCLMSCPT